MNKLRLKSGDKRPPNKYSKNVLVLLARQKGGIAAVDTSLLVNTGAKQSLPSVYNA